jgi:hypothetical protein
MSWFRKAFASAEHNRRSGDWSSARDDDRWLSAGRPAVPTSRRDRTIIIELATDGRCDNTLSKDRSGDHPHLGVVVNATSRADARRPA